MAKVQFKKETACLFTGPRPKNLFGSYDPMVESNKRMLLALREEIIRLVTEEGVETFVTGMALGIDLWAARIVMKLRETNEAFKDVKLVGAVPCAGQESRWPKAGQEEWSKVYDACDEVHFVQAEKYTDGCMQRRNEWMVDHASYCLAVFTGKSGGTMNCMMYAYEQGLSDKVFLLNPYSLRIQKGITG